MGENDKVRNLEVNRPLTAQEQTLTRWMLEHGSGEATSYLEQLDRARVVGYCPCGCASIDFSIDNNRSLTGRMHVLGDFVFGGEADLCGAFVFGQDGLLAGIEVYGLTGDAPKHLPDPKELRPFPVN